MNTKFAALLVSASMLWCFFCPLGFSFATVSRRCPILRGKRTERGRRVSVRVWPKADITVGL